MPRLYFGSKMVVGPAGIAKVSNFYFKVIIKRFEFVKDKFWIDSLGKNILSDLLAFLNDFLHLILAAFIL